MRLESYRAHHGTNVLNPAVRLNRKGLRIFKLVFTFTILYLLDHCMNQRNVYLLFFFVFSVCKIGACFTESCVRKFID